MYKVYIILSICCNGLKFVETMLNMRLIIQSFMKLPKTEPIYMPYSDI